MFAKKFFRIALAILLFGLSFGFALNVQAADDPVTIVKGYYDAVNAGDLQKATDNYAETFVGISPGGRFIGKAEGTTGLMQGIKDGVKFELSNFKNDNGRVVYSYKVLIGGNVVDSGDDGLTIVRDGKIVFDGIVSTEKEWATAVVQGYYAAYNAGNIDDAVNYLADDVVFINPTGRYEGKAKARANLEAIKKDGLSFFLSGFKNDGGRVTYSYNVNINGATAEKGDDGLTIVKNGLIVFDGTTETEKQFETSTAAKTETQLPTTGSAFPNAELWIAIAGVFILMFGALMLKRTRDVK